MMQLQRAWSHLFARDPEPSPSWGPLDSIAAAAQRYTDNPVSLLVLLATLFAGILIGMFGLKKMPWTRPGRWGTASGHFSSFGRGDRADIAVSDADYSYQGRHNVGPSKQPDVHLHAHTTDTSTVPHRESSDDDTDDRKNDMDADQGGTPPGIKKKEGPRRRAGRKHKERSTLIKQSYAYVGGPAMPEDLPGPFRSPSSSSPSSLLRSMPPRQPPPTPMERLQHLSNTLDTVNTPLCRQFLASPPDDSKMFETEYNRLNESLMRLMTDVDDVSTDDDKAVRTMRKKLINTIQTLQTDLDIVGKAQAAGLYHRHEH